ncbi:MAG TPA: hypothetical protein VMS65_09150 [Polyangiaceae bacterium]|nr:hypothetical protein [Polyangiaceae bacterium]
MATFQLSANRWKKVAGDHDGRSRSCIVKVTTGRQCEWDKRPGRSGKFKKSKQSKLFLQNLHIKSPVATTCTRTWLEP